MNKVVVTAVCSTSDVAENCGIRNKAMLLVYSAVRATFNPQYCFPYSFTTDQTFYVEGNFHDWFCTFLYCRMLSIGRVRKFATSEYSLRHVCSHGRTRLPLEGFSWNLIFQYVEKIQVSLNSDKNNRYFTWRPTCIYDSKGKGHPATGRGGPRGSR